MSKFNHADKVEGFCSAFDLLCAYKNLDNEDNMVVLSTQSILGEVRDLLQNIIDLVWLSYEQLNIKLISNYTGHNTKDLYRLLAIRHGGHPLATYISDLCTIHCQDGANLLREDFKVKYFVDGLYLPAL